MIRISHIPRHSRVPEMHYVGAGIVSAYTHSYQFWSFSNDTAGVCFESVVNPITWSKDHSIPIRCPKALTKALSNTTPLYFVFVRKLICEAMDPYYASKPRHSQKRRRSGTALFSLVLLGCGIVFFGIVMIACAFVINYADDFEVNTDDGIEAAVQGGFTFSQYWAGIPVSTLFKLYHQKYCLVSGWLLI